MFDFGRVLICLFTVLQFGGQTQELLHLFVKQSIFVCYNNTFVGLRRWPMIYYQLSSLFRIVWFLSFSSRVADLSTVWSIP